MHDLGHRRSLYLVQAAPKPSPKRVQRLPFVPNLPLPSLPVRCERSFPAQSGTSCRCQTIQEMAICFLVECQEGHQRQAVFCGASAYDGALGWTAIIFRKVNPPKLQYPSLPDPDLPVISGSAPAHQRPTTFGDPVRPHAAVKAMHRVRATCVS